MENAKPDRIPEVKTFPLAVCALWFLTSAPIWIIVIANAKKWELSQLNLCILGGLSHALAFIAFSMWYHHANKPVRDFWKNYTIERTFKIIPKPPHHEQ